MAVTAVSMVPWPEIITTGTCGSSVWMAWRMPRPSSLLPWSQTSRMTRGRSAVPEGGDGGVAVAGLADGVAFVFQHALDQHPDIGLVVDDEDVLCHRQCV